MNKVVTSYKYKLCKVRGCKETAIWNGYCTEHHITRLDKFEKQSRKAKLLVK